MTFEFDQAACVAALHPIFGTRLREHEKLSRHGTFGVGGPADVWVTVTTEDELLALVALAHERRWPLMLVGNGTNVLFSDQGARGIVARMTLSQWSLAQVDETTSRLTAGGGVNLPKLANDLADRGLTGLEWSAGVPGTIGGAIVSNAGAHGMCIADTIESARVLRWAPEAGARIETLGASDLGLDYRRSRFREARELPFAPDGRPLPPPRALIEPGEIITGGDFLLAAAPTAEVWARVNAYRQHRKDTQPSQASAGSVFKNPPGDHSGRLVEAAGLKGTRIGGAQFSPKHANFIVNTGGATAADIIGLVALARTTVLDRFGVALHLEVEPCGDW